MSVPLTEHGEGTISSLMKDDKEYTFFELPRMNPNYKVKASNILSTGHFLVSFYLCVTVFVFNLFTPSFCFVSFVFI